MTAAEQLRARVVTTVVTGILCLAFGLYVLVGFLLIADGQDAVPDALWLAAGTQSGVLGTILFNGRGEPSGPQAVTVEQPYGEPVPVAYEDGALG